MTYEIPPGLPSQLYPLAWLVGTWAGQGSLGYPGIEAAETYQELTFRPTVGPSLAYTATTRLDGPAGPVWQTESGFWRLPDGQTAADGAPRLDPPFEIELVVADPAGLVSVYLGEVEGLRVLLATDLMARTESAAQVDAGRRMYGLVEGDLLWAWDLAAFGHPLQSYMAARLVRQPE